MTKYTLRILQKLVTVISGPGATIFDELTNGRTGPENRTEEQIQPFKRRVDEKMQTVIIIYHFNILVSHKILEENIDNKIASS